MTVPHLPHEMDLEMWSAVDRDGCFVKLSRSINFVPPEVYYVILYYIIYIYREIRLHEYIYIWLHLHLYEYNIYIIFIWIPGSPRPPHFLLMKVFKKKNVVFMWFFGSAAGSGKEKLASWRPFSKDGLTYSQHSLNIGPKMGQHVANIGQHRANIGARQGQHGPR